MSLDAYTSKLLLVFDAVLRERNVPRAASRVSLSQSAMSHALNRLRAMLKDELFIRTPQGMVPTPRAEELAQPFRNALSEMLLALEPTVFDPTSSDRRFVLAVDNYASIALVPQLVAAVSAVAPEIRLDLMRQESANIAHHLDSGSLDLAVSTTDCPGDRFIVRSLLEDSFVLVMRRDHSASRRTLSPVAFAALPHLGIA